MKLSEHFFCSNTLIVYLCSEVNCLYICNTKLINLREGDECSPPFLHCLSLPPGFSGASGPQPQGKPPWCFSWCQTPLRFRTSVWKGPDECFFVSFFNVFHGRQELFLAFIVVFHGRRTFFLHFLSSSMEDERSFLFSANPMLQRRSFSSIGLISNAHRVERSTNFLIMKKRKYGAMPLAKTVWRLLMPCMREHRKTTAANLPSDCMQVGTG